MLRKLLLALAYFCFCGMAGADMLVLESGKTLKADSYVVEGESLRVFLNDRSEMVIPVNWVKAIRIDPDPPVEPELKVAEAIMDESMPEMEFGKLIRELADKHEMDWRLVAAVVRAESNFNPRAVSRKGAQGLMQLMPATARLYRVSDPYDPAQNIDAGIRHLKMLVARYPGNLEWVLAAYNSGEQNVQKYRGIPPFPETRSYVKKVLQFFQGLSS
jgi:hypothetical protein